MAIARKGERVLTIRMRAVDGISAVGKSITSVLKTLKLVGITSLRALLAPLRLVRSAFQHLLSPVGMVQAALGFFAARGMVRFVEGTAQIGDNLDKLNERTGVAVETLAGLGYAAERSGSSLDSLGNALFRMNRRIANAAQGTGPAVRALQMLGLQAEQLQFLGADDQLLEIADALARLGNESLANQMAFEVLGDNARDLMPLMRLGSAGILELTRRAERFGIVISAEQAGLSARFKDTIDDMTDALTGIRQQVGFEFFPILIRQLETVTDWLVNVRPLLVDAASAVANIWRGVQDLGQAIVRWFTEDAKINIESIGEAIKGVGEEVRDVVRGVAAAFGDDDFATRARESLQSIVIIMRSIGFIAGKAFIDGMVAAFSEGFNLLQNVAGIGFENLLVRFRRDWIDTEMQILDGIYELFGGDVLMQRMQALSNERLALMMRPSRSMMNEVQSSMEAWSDETVEIVRTSMQEIGGEIDALMPELQRLGEIGREAFELIARSAADAMNGKDQPDGEAGSKSFLSGAQAAIKAWWKDITDESRRGHDAVLRLIGTMEGGFDRMFDGIVDGSMKAKQAFEQMGRDMLKMIAKILAQEAAIRIIRSIPGFGGTNAQGNAFSNGNVMQFARGAAIAAGAITPFAAGGVVDSPTFFPMSGGRAGLMGEAGPEAIMPLKRNSRGELGVESDGGGMIVNFTYSPQVHAMDGRSAVATLSQPDVMRHIGDAVAHEIGKRRGLRDTLRNL